jgi:hypothetical protein
MEGLVKALLEKIEADVRLSPTHLGLIMGILHKGIPVAGANGMVVSRRKLMAFAKLKATSTYHRSMNQLIAFGYFTYHPSYDPKSATVVNFINL